MKNDMTPSELRRLTGIDEHDSVTAGYCGEYVQANLVALPEKDAHDFEQFCINNPKPCPLLEIVGPGKYKTLTLAKGADLTRALPKYKVFIDGKPKYVVKNIVDFYRKDLVFFLLGCSFSFEEALLKAGIKLRHLEERKNVGMFNTNIDLNRVGKFSGKMVVSMRPIPHNRVVEACIITAHYPELHGAPVHIGSPEAIGINDILKIDYGDPVDIQDNEAPVFWACGVTPQNVLLNAKLPFAITHFPGHMFVSDIRNRDYYRVID